MEPGEAGLSPGGLAGRRIAYIVSRFPKLTETFVLREALALEALGAEVHVFPLVRHEERVVHPEVARLAGRVHRVGAVAPKALGALASTVCAAPRRAARAVSAMWRGVEGSPAHAVRALALLPRIVWVARELERLQVDHVHAHFATHPALAALVAREVAGVAYSFTAHGSDLHRDPRGMRAKVLGSAFTVTVSDYNKRFILEHAGADLAPRVEVLRCGVDLSSFTLRAAEPPAPPFRIACVAALREVKGHTFLLRALRRLVDGGVDAVCELAGDGELRGRLEGEAVALGLGGRVVFLGPRTGAEVRALLARSHVAALTSIQDREGRREGIPVSLMEAMATGLPVVASDLSGIPELVQDGHDGLLATPGDAEAIAVALARLARDPALRQRLGREAERSVRARYDLGRNSAALAARIGAGLGSQSRNKTLT